MRSSRLMRGQAGFTLLEVMIGLVILSLASLAMMQSTVSMMRSTDRAVDVAQVSIETALNRQVYEDALDTFLLSWDEEGRARFRGEARRMSGPMATSLLPDTALGQRAELAVTREGDALLLQLGHREDAVTLARFEGRDARFGYLGRDRAWHAKWPPDTLPRSGIFNDDVGAQMPEWPEAIRLELRHASGPDTVWIKRVDRAKAPLFTPDDI